VALGEFAATARFRGYLPPDAPVPITITRRDQAEEVVVPLARDPAHAVVHLLLRHAEGSPKAITPIESGVTLIRRREDVPSAWRWPVESPAAARRKRTLEDLQPGTYDILVWNGGRFPAVAVLIGLVVEGGTESTHEVELKSGYGFRPSDVLAGPRGTLRRLRASCDLLGVLPWVDNFEGPGIHFIDAEGFTQATAAGYIGPYPSEEIRIVEQPTGGSPREHAVRASIRPAR
jgi:hypothetical protein